MHFIFSSSTSALKRPRTSPHLSDDLSNGETNVINIKQEEQQQQPQEASTSLYANTTTSVPYQFNSSFFENNNQQQQHSSATNTGSDAVDQPNNNNNIRDNANDADATTNNGQTTITTNNANFQFHEKNDKFVTGQHVMETAAAEYAMTATNSTGAMVDTSQQKGINI